MIKYIKSDKSNSEIKLNAIKAFRNLQADIDEMKSIVDSWEADLFDNDNIYSEADYSTLYDAFRYISRNGLDMAYATVQERDGLINQVLSGNFNAE